MISSVQGLGIAPGTLDIEYVEGESISREIEYVIRNNDGYDRDIQLKVEGELAEYAEIISLTSQTILNDEFKRYTVQLQIPSNWEPEPGAHKLKVVAKDAPSDREGTGITARTGVISTVRVHVPYPGRYAEITELEAARGSAGINEGDKLPVSFQIRNRGYEDLEDTRAVLKLMTKGTRDEAGEVYMTYEFDDLDIPAGEAITKIHVFESQELLPSDYKVELLYYYEDSEGEVVERREVDRFLIGTFTVELYKFPNEIEKKGIVPVSFFGKSKWKGFITSEATLAVEGTQETTSARVEIGDFQVVEHVIYLNTDPLELGEQTGVLTFRVQRDDSGVRGIENVIETPISFTLIEPVVPQEESPLFGSSGTYVIILLILLLIAIIILISAHLKRQK